MACQDQRTLREQLHKRVLEPWHKSHLCIQVTGYISHLWCLRCESHHHPQSPVSGDLLLNPSYKSSEKRERCQTRETSSLGSLFPSIGNPIHLRISISLNHLHPLPKEELHQFTPAYSHALLAAMRRMLVFAHLSPAAQPWSSVVAFTELDVFPVTAAEISDRIPDTHFWASDAMSSRADLGVRFRRHCQPRKAASNQLLRDCNELTIWRLCSFLLIDGGMLVVWAC